MRQLVAVALLIVASALAGCAAPVVEAAMQGRDTARRGGLEQAANAGDPKAQLELGNTYCCALTGQTDTAISAYDNEKATYWMCKAAGQGHAPAAYRLAQVYSGDTVSGVRLMRRIAQATTKSPTDIGVALMWARRAAAQNIPGGVDLANELSREATPAELQRANQLANAGPAAPCTWSQVFTASR
jgi:TPR repeat protein